MITTGDARNILIEACSVFNIKDVCTSWVIPEGRIKKERVVVVTPSRQSAGTYWENCIVAVNLCVPDIKGDANIRRMDELERAAKSRFRYWTYGTYDGSAYLYKAESIGREEDSGLDCHYVYISIIFKVLNVKNN